MQFVREMRVFQLWRERERQDWAANGGGGGEEGNPASGRHHHRTHFRKHRHRTGTDMRRQRIPVGVDVVVVDDDDDIKDCVVKSFIIIPNSFSAAATMSSDAIKMFSSILISLSDE